jgi:hypothetical protein
MEGEKGGRTEGKETPVYEVMREGDWTLEQAQGSSPQESCHAKLLVSKLSNMKFSLDCVLKPWVVAAILAGAC